MVKIMYAAKKLKASSLVEVTVAMVIFVALLSCSLVAYLKLTTSGLTAKKLEYDLVVADYALKTKAGKHFLDEEVERGEIKLVRRVREYESRRYLLSLIHI